MTVSIGTRHLLSAPMSFTACNDNESILLVVDPQEQVIVILVIVASYIFTSFLNGKFDVVAALRCSPC